MILTREEARQDNISKQIIHLYREYEYIEIHRIAATTTIFINHTAAHPYIKLILDADFPFSPPEIFVARRGAAAAPEWISYSHFLSFRNIKKLKPELALLFHAQCICCYSFMSRVFWSPRDTCLKVVRELDYMTELRARVLQLYLLHKLAARVRWCEYVVFEIFGFLDARFGAEQQKKICL